MLAEQILRPILIKILDISTMEELETVLEELSTKSKTSKLWIVKFSKFKKKKCGPGGYEPPSQYSD